MYVFPSNSRQYIWSSFRLTYAEKLESKWNKFNYGPIKVMQVIYIVQVYNKEKDMRRRDLMLKTENNLSNA